MKRFIALSVAIYFSFGATAAADEVVEEGDDNGVTVTTVELPMPRASGEVLLDGDELAAQGPRSSQDILRLFPGVTLSQHGSEGKAAQFFVRGFDAAHGTDLTLSIDGLALNEASHIHGHGYADSGLIIPEALRRVTARTGPFELDQGNLSTAGNVDFELGVPTERRGMRAGTEFGWPLRGRVWSVWAPPEADQRQLTALEVIGDAGPFENRSTRRFGAIHQQQVGELTIRGGIQAARFGLPGAVPASHIDDGRIERGETYTPTTGGESAQLWAGAIHESQRGAWSGRTSMDLRGRQFDGRENFTGFLIHDEEGDERREFQRGLSLTLAHATGVELTESLVLMGYAGIVGDVFTQFEDGLDQRGEPFERERGGSGRQGNFYFAPGVDLFAADWFRLRGGVRFEAMAFDYVEDEQVGGEEGQAFRAVAAPRMRASFYFGDHWSASVAGGRGFRGPEARAVAAEREVEADEDLSRYDGGRPEITIVDAAELGLVFEPSPGTYVSATAFGFYSEGEFIYDHVSRLHVDLGATRRVGLELAGQLQFGEVARLRAHISTVDARFVDDGEPIPFAPPIEAGATLLAMMGHGLTGGLQWNATGRRPLPFGASAAGRQLLSAYGAYEWNQWEFSLHMDNLLNSQWNEGVYHYASRFDLDEPRSSLPQIHVVAGHPRTVRAGLSYRW